MRFLGTCFLFLSFLTLDARVLHVLAIGNSFSQDAIEQNLSELALAGGDTLIIGNAYIPGCQIDLHLKNILSDKAMYSYRKVVNGIKSTRDTTALSTILSDEPWDIISLQQASHVSGKTETYSGLPELKREVISRMPNKDAEIIWHMTWAYAKDSDHSGFKNYGNSQKIMNDSIYFAVCSEIPKNGISRVVPAGTAIQYARGIFGDVLNSDGYHLSKLGRYVAACTWYEFLTGKSVLGNPYRPDFISEKDARRAQKAAHKAVNKFRLRKLTR